MQQVAEGFSKLTGGVIGNLFSKSSPPRDEPKNIEYVDEMSSRLYPDLHYSDIIGAQKTDAQAVEDEFELIDTSEVNPPSCPYYYIPFSQPVDLCEKLIHNWLEQIWFLPSDWKTALKIRQARPCLVPFFVFDVKTRSDIEGEILLDVDGQRKWVPKTDTIESEYHEIIACGSCSVNQKLIDKLLYAEERGFSFHTQQALPTQLQPYPPRGEGLYTVKNEAILPIDITREEAWNLYGRHKIEEMENQKGNAQILSQNKYDGHGLRDLNVVTEFTNFQQFVLYLPVYFSSVDYNDKTYEVLVSGNKGVVVGNSPTGTGSGGKFIMDKLKSFSSFVSDTIPM